MYEKNKHKRTQLLTVEFRFAGIQCLDIDGVVCDEASLLIYRQFIPLDVDLSILMDQH